MQKFNVDIKRNSSSAQIPAGAYVAKIMGAREVVYSWGSRLEISFDITEGEYKDFFANKYRNDDSENKKWKGVYRLTVPQVGNQYYENQVKTFGNAMACIEESNDGYSWNWDENSLKGLSVGVLFRDEEYDIDGRRGWASQCFALLSVEEVQQGKFRVPQPKALKETHQPSTFPSANAPSWTNANITVDDDLPF